jgi:hypothetical protein
VTPIPIKYLGPIITPVLIAGKEYHQGKSRLDFGKFSQSLILPLRSLFWAIEWLEAGKNKALRCCLLCVVGDSGYD